ncbi:hypothetical protein Tco_0104817 [Tanacetum coccineum]
MTTSYLSEVFGMRSISIGWFSTKSVVAPDNGVCAYLGSLAIVVFAWTSNCSLVRKITLVAGLSAFLTQGMVSNIPIVFTVVGVGVTVVVVVESSSVVKLLFISGTIVVHKVPIPGISPMSLRSFPSQSGWYLGKLLLILFGIGQKNSPDSVA